MAPTTAEDFWQLAAGHEKTARKWRVGDAAKSVRGFLRALEVYNRGMQLHPANFELAYDRAQTYMTITQEPRFLPYLPLPQIDFLKSTIEANRYVLNLDPEAADVLFNTAQALSSLAEELSEQKSDRLDAMDLLIEAVELYDKCLAQQAELITEADEMAREAESEAQMRAKLEDQELDCGFTPMDTDTKKDEPQEQTEVNATLIDPTTEDDMIDTGLSELSALTSLCALYDHVVDMTDSLVANPSFPFLEHHASDLLEHGILVISTRPQAATCLRAIEIRLARASFVCALSAAHYRARDIDASNYFARVEEVYDHITSSISSSTGSSEVLCAHAESLQDFATTLTQIHAAFRIYPNPYPFPIVDPADWPRLRWRALAHAQSLLKDAADLPNAKKDPLAQSRIYALKAAIELLRLRSMAAFAEDHLKSEWSTNGVPVAESSVESEGTPGTPQANLVANAGVYYRGAVKWLRAAEETTWKERAWNVMGDEERDLLVREWVVNMLKVEVLDKRQGLQWKIESGLERFQDSVGMGSEGLEMAANVVKDMKEERLVPLFFADALYGHVCKAI
ncbi:MAG: hypothetical protein Q9165_003131 [Trypethelium subeluteriae]